MASPPRTTLGSYLERQLVEELGFVLLWRAPRRLLMCFVLVLAVLPTAAAADDRTAGAEVADLAAQYVGARYRWGGMSPAGFDCTGFVVWVFSQFGVAMPRSEAGQLATGTRVDRNDLEPGDVLVFANTYRAGLSHVGIYLGDGRFVHAANERSGVTVSSMWDGYWSSRFVGASRALA